MVAAGVCGKSRFIVKVTYWVRGPRQSETRLCCAPIQVLTIPLSKPSMPHHFLVAEHKPKRSCTTHIL